MSENDEEASMSLLVARNICHETTSSYTHEQNSLDSSVPLNKATPPTISPYKACIIPRDHCAKNRRRSSRVVRRKRLACRLSTCRAQGPQSGAARRGYCAAQHVPVCTLGAPAGGRRRSDWRLWCRARQSGIFIWW